MTTKEAFKIVHGAEISATNVPIRKLQSALLVILTAANRAMKYDKHFMDENSVDMVAVPDCSKCYYNGEIAHWDQCDHCIGNTYQTNNFVAKEEIHHCDDEED